MPSMYKNAVASIRMGVEDYQQEQDAYRHLSAVRNFYAGTLLLAKVLLIQSALKADQNVVIASKIKLSLDETGGIKAVADGNNTINYDQIQKRFKIYGLNIDATALIDLHDIRNDIEHKASKHTREAVRAAIANTYTVVASLFRQMDEEPAAALGGNVWKDMLSEKSLYDAELKDARDTLSNIAWYSGKIDESDFSCLECQSKLMAQLDEENTDQAAVEFKCRACGSKPDLSDMIENAVNNKFGVEAHYRARDGEEGPIYDCPICDRNCLIELEGGGAICVNCNEPHDYDSECTVCGAYLTRSEHLEGMDGALCRHY